MQNIRGRARLLARRHARVHFNLAGNNRTRLSAQHNFLPEDELRDKILKRLIVYVKKMDREFSTSTSQTNTSIEIVEDSLTTARIRHEQSLLDELIELIEDSGDEPRFAERLKRDLLNWIARNEVELEEIDALKDRVEKRHVQLLHESHQLQRLFSDIKSFERTINKGLNMLETEMTTLDSAEIDTAKNFSDSLGTND